jgi:hypothetical protein
MIRLQTEKKLIPAFVQEAKMFPLTEPIRSRR